MQTAMVWTSSMYGQQPDPQEMLPVDTMHQPMGSVDLVVKEQHGRMSSRGTSKDWVPSGQQRQKQQLKIGQFGSISPVRQPVQKCMKLTGKVR